MEFKNYGPAINIIGENGLAGTLGDKFTLGTVKDENGKYRFQVKPQGIRFIQYKNPDGKNVSVTLKAGAEVLFGTNGAYVLNGTVNVSRDNTIMIPPASKGEAELQGKDEENKGKLPDATGTNAVVKETSDGGYNVSNGDIVIREGNFIAYGVGATYKTGSVIAGQNVTSGSITSPIQELS